MGDRKSWNAYVTKGKKPAKVGKKILTIAHKLGKKLKKHQDGVKAPYALGMWMAKKGIRPKKKSKK